jgi:cell shape-determining protein MreD
MWPQPDESSVGRKVLTGAVLGLALGALGLGLEVSLLNAWSYAPLLFPLFLGVVALLCEARGALTAAFMLGLFQDVLVGSPLGLFALVALILTPAAAWAFRELPISVPFLHAVVFVLLAVVARLLIIVFSLFWKFEAGFAGGFGWEHLKPLPAMAIIGLLLGKLIMIRWERQRYGRTHAF